MPLEGSREGAPDAIQVADRFHLWQNLCDAVEKTVISCRADLAEPDPGPAGPGPGQLITGPSPRSSRLDRFAPYLQQRWDQGCTDAAQLFAGIQALGYSGSKRSARRYLQPPRATLTAAVLPSPPLTVREVTRWITSRPDHLTDDETAQPGRVKARSTQLSATAGHVTAFAEMMTGRHGEHLPGWIAAVDACDLPHLHSFTRGIRRDQAAVANGLTLDHSSGAVEGNVCRVKALKRQMSGRANLDLLRKRILLRT
jgi:transposase